MRFLFSLLFSLFLLQGATAQVITRLSGGVSHFSYNTSDLLGVVTSALDGDTIILPGGPLNIGGLSVTKNITFVGAGILQSGTPVTGQTQIVYAFQQDIVISAGGNGSSFHGIHFMRPVRFTGGVSSVSFVRCSFDSGLSLAGFQQIAANNIIIKQCIFAGSLISGGSAPQNLSVSNTFLSGGIDFGQGISTATFSQCIIFGVTNTQTNRNQGVIYTNNVLIFGPGTSNTGLYNASYYNNLFCRSTGNIINWQGAFDGGENVGFQMAANNPFVNVPLNTLGSFIPSNDYQINTQIPTNPATAMGQGGYNVGVYGGPPGNPWKPNAIPFNPHWTGLLPSGGSLGTTTGGVINVTIQGAAQQN